MESTPDVAPQDAAMRLAAARTMSRHGTASEPRTPAAARSWAAARAWAEAMSGSGGEHEAPACDTPASRRSGSSWRSWNTRAPTVNEGSTPGRRLAAASRSAGSRRTFGGVTFFEEGPRVSREEPDLEAPPSVADHPGVASGCMASKTRIDGDPAVLLPQGSLRSTKSIMQGVRERMERLEGSPAAARTTRRAKTGATRRTTRAASGRTPSEDDDSCTDGATTARDTSRLPIAWFNTGTLKRRCSIPFRVALLCPIVSMMLACLGTFVPLVFYTNVTQQDIRIAYNTSLHEQGMLIYDTTEQATQWLFTQVLLNTDKEVFVGLIEPADRAVDTLWGALTAMHFEEEYYYKARLAVDPNYVGDPLFFDKVDDVTKGQGGGATARRKIMQRAWQELQNQWGCKEQSNKLCSGRVDSLYAALVTEQYAGASYREHNGSTEKKVLRAEGGEEEGATTSLSSWTSQTAWGDEEGVMSVIENYSSVSEPWFTVQSAERDKWADAEGTNSSEVPKKLWSKLYFMNPWTKYSDDGSGQLGMSWTTPVAYCGNYSCFDGVVSADITLDRLDTILEQQWKSLQRDLLALSSYELSQNTSSIFIVNRASPRFPEQEGLLIGSSSDGAGESSAQSDELTLAKDSDHEVVKLASRAVLEKYGTDSWANVLVNPDETEGEEPFYFSKSKLESTGELDSEACTPLAASKSPEEALKPWAPDCFQVALKTMMLDEKLEWLMVVVLPSAAFRKQSQQITEIEEKAEEAMNMANARTEQLMTWALVLGGIIAAVSLSMTVGFSFLVLRPLDRLGFLMKKLGQLDFAQNSREFRKLHKGVMGFVTEVNDLQDGFCRLSKSIEIFARFVPETVVRGLVRGEDRKLRPYVDPRNVTIMFSDIRDFTTISEKLSQDDLCFVLYLYLNAMIEIIEEEEGVVAEVLGDGLLAFWNTPDNVKNHEAKACNAALRQQEALRILNEKLAVQGLPQLAIRIGIHTGQVLTGNLGSETKMKFGCMGDPVNLASRLEGLCKMYGIGVMISGTTYQALPSTSGFACRRLDLVQVKGKKEPTMIYELMGRDIQDRKTDNADEVERSLGVEPFRKAQAANYERALQAYQQARFQEAVQIAGELPVSDVAGQKLLERAKGYVGWRGTSLSKEELANWTGVVGMTDK